MFSDFSVKLFLRLREGLQIIRPRSSRMEPVPEKCYHATATATGSMIPADFKKAVPYGLGPLNYD